MRGDKILDMVRQEIQRLEKIAQTIETNQIIDFGARLHVNTDTVKSLDESIKDRIKAELGEGIHNGIHAKAVVQAKTRETLDTKAIKTTLPENLWQPFIKVVAYTELNYKLGD